MENPEKVMRRVREVFEKSNKTLDELGIAMGYEGDVARKSAWQFLNKTADPRLSMLQRFAIAMSVPLADVTGYGHDSREVSSGEQVHLIKIPEKKWGISSYDWSWLSKSNGLMLMNARVFAQMVGWEGMQFDTANDAYSFVEQEIKKGKVPSKTNPFAPIINAEIKKSRSK
jgi:transcriptional regulator with XRE-family HTH domain